MYQSMCVDCVGGEQFSVKREIFHVKHLLDRQIQI